MLKIFSMPFRLYMVIYVTNQLIRFQIRQSCGTEMPQRLFIDSDEIISDLFDVFFYLYMFKVEGHSV